MELSIIEKIQKLIELNQITEKDDERIGPCIADRFPDQYDNEQEYIEFNEAITALIPA